MSMFTVILQRELGIAGAHGPQDWTERRLRGEREDHLPSIYSAAGTMLGVLRVPEFNLHNNTSSLQMKKPGSGRLSNLSKATQGVADEQRQD